MRNGNEKSSSSSLDFDVALGLSTETSSSSYTSSCKRAAATTNMPFSNYYSNNNSYMNSNPAGFSGDGGTMLNQLSGGGLVVADSNNIYQEQQSTGACFSGAQWQELERQKMIHKFMMASMPVPPQLLFPPPPTTTAVSQSPSLELRFPSSGSDPEPWRCKRTDGKKWRCSRDVAPDQKYCERHAHKSRTRSRKPVELSPHNKFYNTNKTSTSNTTASQSHTILQRPATSSLFPTMASAGSGTPYNDQTRSIDWFLRGGSNANQRQQWQQQVIPTPSSTTLDFTRDTTNTDPHHIPNVPSSVYDPYIPDTNFNDSQTTRHFIDAWEKEGSLEDISNKSNTKKFSLSSSSLSLSMFGNGIDEENGSDYLGIGMNDKESDIEITKQQQPVQWMNMNSISWLNNNNSMSPPGGPLGEALCLGSSGTTRGNLASSSTCCHRGYSNNNSNNTTNSSSCSKSSCEDGNQQHALNFIG